MKYVDLKENIFLNKIPNLKDLRFLNSIFKKNNFELRIIGGAVRDILQDKTPKDIDLATDATPDEILKITTDHNLTVIPTGIQHGTLTVLINSTPYEITTLRIDKNQDGRHADVKFIKNWEEDANRRDLTFNAISMDLDGNIYDYHGGKQDLIQGKARFIGNASDRINEDFLRILRYFRFQGKLPNLNWDKETLDAIKNNAFGLDKISGERIYSEINKILLGNYPGEILKKMKETGVSKYINLDFDFDEKFLNKILENSKDPIIGLSFILPNIEEAKKLNSRYKLQNSEKTLLYWLIDKKYQNYSVKEALYDILINKQPKELWLKYFILKNKTKSYEFLKNMKIPVFPVTGEDLIKKGIKPGPELGKKLNKLKIKWFEKDFKPSKTELLSDELLTEDNYIKNADIVINKKEKIKEKVYVSYYNKIIQPFDSFEIYHFDDILGNKVFFNLTNSNKLILPNNTGKLGEIFNTKKYGNGKYRIPEKIEKIIKQNIKN